MSFIVLLGQHGWQVGNAKQSPACNYRDKTGVNTKGGNRGTEE